MFSQKITGHKHIWDLFSSKYDYLDLPEGANSTEGYGAIGEDAFYFIISAVPAGLYVENPHASTRTKFIVPWSDISRLDKAMLVSIKNKPCKPRLIARLYLWREFSKLMVLPWSTEFDKCVPTSVAVNDIGNVQIH